MGRWNLDDYSAENQLRDIINVRDTITCDDRTIFKGNDVDIYWKSNSSQLHGHGGVKYDEDGNMTDCRPYHS